MEKCTLQKELQLIQDMVYIPRHIWGSSETNKWAQFR